VRLFDTPAYCSCCGALAKTATLGHRARTRTRPQGWPDKGRPRPHGGGGSLPVAAAAARTAAAADAAAAAAAAGGSGTPPAGPGEGSGPGWAGRPSAPRCLQPRRARGCRPRGWRWGRGSGSTGGPGRCWSRDSSRSSPGGSPRMVAGAWRCRGTAGCSGTAPWSGRGSSPDWLRTIDKQECAVWARPGR